MGANFDEFVDDLLTAVIGCELFCALCLIMIPRMRSPLVVGRPKINFK